LSRCSAPGQVSLVKPGERPLQIPGIGLSIMMARLMAASWETVLRRSLLMARGACSGRMTAEKIAAMQTATGALIRGKGRAAMLAPFVSRARSNAKRLRRKG
jgi:hypothetical protein